MGTDTLGQVRANPKHLIPSFVPLHPTSMAVRHAHAALSPLIKLNLPRVNRPISLYAIPLKTRMS